MPHSAILLAGGKSSRMGRDKAALLVDGLPLWQRQLAQLQATGPVETFISGQPGGLYAYSGIEVIADAWPDCGPLGGLASAGKRCGTLWSLLLAVDMPRMTSEYLHTLVEEALRTGRGVVPRFADGRWQSLAAIYPREAGPVAESLLAQDERRMEIFVRELEARRLVDARMVSVEEQVLFENWNSPDDLPAASR